MPTDTQPPVAPILLPSGHWTSLPQVTMRTSLGTVVYDLYPNQAPLSVANWLAYVQANFYSNLIFHRVIPGFMVQGGGFSSGLVQLAPLYASIPLESDTGLFNQRGTLAMARTSDPNSATDQFYINLVNNSFLNFSPTNPGYAVFGQVSQGIDVIDQIASVATQTVGSYANVPVADVVILDAQETAGGTLQTGTGVITVSGLESQASWAYSVNGGVDWTTGQGQSFILQPGNYAANAIQVRQTDAAGNVSTVSKLAGAVSVLSQSLQVTITSDRELLNANQAAHLSFVLNQDSTDFSATDVHVQGGSLSAFTGSGRNYSATFTPQAASQGQAVVEVASGTFHNASGQINLDDQSLALRYDTQAPLAPLLLPQGTWTRNPVVTLQTTAGVVTVALLPNAAPLTTANWLHYVNTGFYDGILFHNVLPGVLVQTGTYASGLVAQTATLPPIALESNNGLLHQPGALAMVHSSAGPNTATSGFFVDLANNAFLNYASPSSPGYAVFGQVTQGLSVLTNISNVATLTGNYAGVPVTDVSIQNAVQTVSGVVQNNSGMIQVAQLEAQASWRYSLDAGQHWQTGQGTALTLERGSYGPGSIQIQQMDAAGNVSVSAPLDSVVNVGMKAAQWLNQSVLTQIQLIDHPDLHSLEVQKTAPTNKTEASISLSDVLGALKVYLHKPLPTEYSSVYNAVAADFDGNGTVNLTDVLNLLKYYLGKPTGDIAPQWVFVPEGTTQAHGAAISASNALPDPIPEPSSSDTVQLIGILRGDVDGSWALQA